MGLVVNKPTNDLRLHDLLEQLSIKTGPEMRGTCPFILAARSSMVAGSYCMNTAIIRPFRRWM